jgi:hypothetical protein
MGQFGPTGNTLRRVNFSKGNGKEEKSRGSIRRLDFERDACFEARVGIEPTNKSFADLCLDLAIATKSMGNPEL